MEKNKEVVKKSCSDAYDSKKINITKSNHFKTECHLSIKSDVTKRSYVSRSKNAQNQVDRKYGFYGTEAKSYLKHTCDKCKIKPGSHLVVNALSNDTTTDGRKNDSGPDINGNLTFSTHQALCSYSCSVSEISNFNKVLKYQSSRQNELSLSRCGKYKQKTAFSDQRHFSSKISHHSTKFSPTAANSNISCHCSKNAETELYFQTSGDKANSENITVTNKCSIKCEGKCTGVINALSKNSVKVADLPVVVHSDLTKSVCTSSKASYCVNDKFQIIKKQRKRLSKKWDQIPVLSDLDIESSELGDTDTMLFPALPSNSRNQQMKLNSSHTGSMPPSEHSSAENSDLESVHSLPSGSVNCIASSPLSTSVSSTIPQASYADVIRMSTSSCVPGFPPLDYEKTPTNEQNLMHTLANSIQNKLQKDENSQSVSSDWVISRLSQLDQNSSNSVNSISLSNANQNGQNFVAPRPIVVSLEKPSFYNSSLQANKNVLSALASHTNLSPPDQKTVDNENLIIDCLCNLEKISVDKISMLPNPTHGSCGSDLTNVPNVQGTSIKTDSVYSSPSSISSLSDAFKPAEKVNMDNFLKTKEPPVIIMNSCSPPESMSEISFGIEYEEMVKLCADTCDVTTKNASSLTLQHSNECLISEESVKTDDTNLEPLEALALPHTSSSETIKSESEAAIDKCISVRGKKIYWTDCEVDSGKSNHIQLAEYFACTWNELEKDGKKDSGQNGNVKYFHDL